MKHRRHRWVGTAIVALVFCAAMWLLHNELKQYHLRDFWNALTSIPPTRLIVAILLTLASYLVLVGHDVVAVSFVRRPIEANRIVTGSLLGFAAANTLGTMLGGSTVRYRLYSAWGFSIRQIVTLMLVITVTFWIGMCGLGMVVFVVQPLSIPARLHLPMATTRSLGVLLGCIAGGYLLLSAFYGNARQFRHLRFPILPWRLAAWPFVVAAIDFHIVAAALYVLLPASVEMSFYHFLGLFLLAMISALITQVPGGAGVFELLLLILLDPQQPDRVVGSLLAFRVIYYLIPLIAAVTALGIRELRLRSEDGEEIEEEAIPGSTDLL